MATPGPLMTPGLTPGAAPMAPGGGALQRLPPEVNRILYVRNLPFEISAEELYKIFGDYGAIRQIRLGSDKKSRGTAFVVYEDIFDAKRAQEGLSGFNVQNRYLIVIYWNHKRQQQHRSYKAEEAKAKDLASRHAAEGQA